MTKKLIILLIASIINNYCIAQTVLMNGVAAERPLTWDDFVGEPDPASPHDAYIYWNIRYRFQPTFVGDSIKIKPEVVLELSNKSWVKQHKKTKDLLKHEQGHFDIGLLCAQQITKALEQRTFTKENMSAEVAKTFKEILEEYRRLERAYDADTGHSQYRKQQKKWDILLAERLLQ